MNEELKDKGLKRAIKEQPQFRLSSNFTFRTMQKVEEAALLREKRMEQRTLWATIIASLLLPVIRQMDEKAVFQTTFLLKTIPMADSGKKAVGF